MYYSHPVAVHCTVMKCNTHMIRWIPACGLFATFLLLCKIFATFLLLCKKGRDHCARATKRNRLAMHVSVMPLPGPCNIATQTRHLIPVSKLHDIASARFFYVAWPAVKYLLLLGVLHCTACTVLSWLPNVLPSQTW